MRETALYFGFRYDMKKMDPLIVLDSCEVLGHSKIYTPYTLLETLCCDIAGPQKMFAIGCGGPTKDLSSYRTTMTLEPFLPLSESAHKDAATKSWGKAVDVILYGPIHRWAAGLPRLLVAAHTQCTDVICLASGCLDAVATFFQRFQAAASSSYSKIRPEWFPQAFSCLLISSTKLKVYHDECIPINPKWRSLLKADDIIAIDRNSKTSLGNDWGQGGTFRQAAARSIGWHLHDKKRFVVPPIIFTDKVMNGLMLENGIQDPLIMPSQLHPPIADEIAWRLGKCSNSERGRLFNKPFVYAVYARYLLAYWGNPRSEWVRLTDVFEGAFQERQKYDISNYEVNLSGGVHVKDSGLLYTDAVPNALTYFGSPAHHDAYMFCRIVENGVVTWEGAVPLQMRHEPKPRDLADKMWTTGKPQPKKLSTKSGKKGTPIPPREAVRLLFCVNQSECKVLSHKRIVMIAADRMSSVSSLWPHSKEGNVKCIVGTKENIINVGEAF
ncbi:Bodo-specific multi-copy gene family, putative [Bodo saltans]|uniref:Bodo-specific multi-copy gene family, putative n=1 Tax=Bodo saltans TaxID=75058 RepID=A0A0S4IW80_BODSA|nr:Bodo-specific multi-copy gene family, putative [Bodo saltans]|eukprot:CUG05409.1 Bodo-specific multi-copy gene family, putative [Bodo saltans]